MTNFKKKIPIVVITPTKNESWVIKPFLKATTQFADHVIIADQQSTDNTVDLCNEFPNVTVINNNGLQYDEAYRQRLLLDTARKMFPGEKIIVALDADEIVSANSIYSSTWDEMKIHKPGTIFYFEKPEIYIHVNRTIRYRNRYYPLAFLDDDSIAHQPKQIHSIRIPNATNQPRVDIDDIKFLHIAYLRPKTQRAKYRFYAVQENIMKTSPWYRRRRRYRNGNHLLYWEAIENTPLEWIDYHDNAYVNFSHITDPDISWYDVAVKEAFEKYGTKKFWLDDIWDQEWNTMFNSSHHLKLPPKLLISFLRVIDRFNK